MAYNVLNSELEVCCMDPMTGYYRNGTCDTGRGDHGQHTVCVEMTDEFLQFALEQGNDLITPMLDYNFPGLVEGNRWCVCVGTVVDAIDNGIKPKLRLKATHMSVKEYLDMDVMMEHAIDIDSE